MPQPLSCIGHALFASAPLAQGPLLIAVSVCQCCPAAPLPALSGPSRLYRPGRILTLSKHAQGGTCVVISDETNLAAQASKHFEDIIGCKACHPASHQITPDAGALHIMHAEHVMLCQHAARCMQTMTFIRAHAKVHIRQNFDFVQSSHVGQCHRCSTGRPTLSAPAMCRTTSTGRP